MSSLTACLPLTLKYSSILNCIPSRLAVVIMSCVCFPVWCVCLNHIWNEWLKVSLSVITRNAKPIDCVRVAINKFKSQCACSLCHLLMMSCASAFSPSVPKTNKVMAERKGELKKMVSDEGNHWKYKGPALCRHLCINSCLHSLEAGSNTLSADYLT